MAIGLSLTPETVAFASEDEAVRLTEPLAVVALVIAVRTHTCTRQHVV